MQWIRCAAALYCAVSACHAAATPRHNSGKSGEVTFTNTNRLLFDVDGNQIDAYGSKVNYFNGTYYLYGNSFSTTGSAFGIKSYSSPNLQDWRYEGFLFNPNATNPCAESGGCGRPHIVYSPKTGKYVLWANAGSSGYVVATSTSPSGPFIFLAETASIDPQFDSLQPADFAVETFGGEGYIVYSVLNYASPNAGSLWPPIFQTLHISRLTDDFQNTTITSYPVTSGAFDLVDQEAESPDLYVTEKGEFYVSASNTCGYCNGSIGLVYRSNSIEGPWTREIISGYSCNGQVEGLLPLQSPLNGETTLVWHSTTVPGSPRTGFGGHIFQPLQFEANGSVADLDCAISKTFEVDFELGTEAIPRGPATEAVDGSPLIADYSYVCDLDQFTVYQTWEASESGTLQSVSINVAKSVQTAQLTFVLFKFSSYADLVAPEYKWTELGTASYNASELTYVFDVANVTATSNQTINAGDLLGFSMNGQDSVSGGVEFVPYCYLEYDTGASSHKLFTRGYGQNSYRGLNGKTSPVYQRFGKGVKFFVTYE